MRERRRIFLEGRTAVDFPAVGNGIATDGEKGERDQKAAVAVGNVQRASLYSGR